MTKTIANLCTVLTFDAMDAIAFGADEDKDGNGQRKPIHVTMTFAPPVDATLEDKQLTATQLAALIAEKLTKQAEQLKKQVDDLMLRASFVGVAPTLACVYPNDIPHPSLIVNRYEASGRTRESSMSETLKQAIQAQQKG